MHFELAKHHTIPNADVLSRLLESPELFYRIDSFIPPCLSPHHRSSRFPYRIFAYHITMDSEIEVVIAPRASAHRLSLSSEVWGYSPLIPRDTSNKLSEREGWFFTLLIPDTYDARLASSHNLRSAISILIT